MAGAVLAAIQIMNCVFSGKEPIHGVFDWAFAMAIIAALVIFSFRYLDKIQEELLTKEQEATESRRSLQHIIDNTEDAILVFDKSGNCTFANRALEKMSGYSVEKLTTMNLREILTPDDYRFLMDKTQNSSLDGMATYDNFFCVLQQQHGGKIPVRMHLMPLKNRSGNISGFEAVIREVREQHYETERTRQERERCLRAVAKVGHIMLASQTEIPYEQVLELLGRAIEATSASITLRNGNSADRPTKIAVWQNPEFSVETPAGAPPYTTPEMDARQTEQGHTLYLPTSYGHHGRPALILPLVTSHGPLGFITFCKQPGDGEWNSLHINLLQTAASMLAGAIERQQANKLLKQHFVYLARAMAGSISFIDPYTASHQERVARMAHEIGTRLGLNNEQCEWLYFGGLLHDIGKAAIPVSILSKPGKLETEEWILIKSHVKRGCQLLEEIELPEIVIKMVLQHHERLDGSGYPNGVSGDEICLEARILGVCDVVEAMSSHRPYRPALPLDQIISELKTNQGTKYDTQITELVLDLISSNSSFLRNDSSFQAPIKITQSKTA
jgi:PAS domain S-box-containing protein/putative nucleotidyltransferase with HDIG domain